MATQNVNGRLSALENVTAIGTRSPGYLAGADWGELEARLADLPPGARPKIYLRWSPDDWDDPPGEADHDG